jgi:hypothetical protein
MNQTSGDVVQFASTGVSITFQGDGNLVIKNKAGTQVWHSGTNGSGADRILVHKMRGLQLKAADGSQWGRHVWWTGPDDNDKINVTFMAVEPWIMVDQWNGNGDVIWSGWDQKQ